MSLTSTNDIRAMDDNAEFAIDPIAKHLDDLQEGYVKRTATATNYTATVSDVYIGVTSTAAARTITLPAAATCGSGKTYIIKDESGAAGTNNITVDANAAETIDGAATKVINANYGVVRLVCDGTHWFTA